MKRTYLILFLLLAWVSRADATYLSTTAAALSAGSFAQMTNANMPGWNNGGIMWTTGCSTYTNVITQYGNKALWNPVANIFQYAGSAHADCGVPNPKFVKYTDSTDTWSAGPQPNGSSAQPQHSYDQNTIDPATGVHYYNHYNNKVLQSIVSGGSSWVNTSTNPEGSNQCCTALAWFPDYNGGTVWWYDGDWGVRSCKPNSASNPTSCTWVHHYRTGGNDGSGKPILTGLTGYPVWMQYSSLCQCLILGKSPSGGNVMWKINSDGSATQLSFSGGPSGVSCCSGNSSITVDPVSGKLIIMQDTAFWEFNPVNSAWVSLAATVPSFLRGSGGAGADMIVAPISDYGVIMYVKCSSSSCQAWLYKHAATAGDTTAPTAPSGLTLSVISSTQINLAWTASTDAVGVTGYNVERCSGSSCSPTVQVYTPASNSQNDTGLTASTIYGYRVRAHDAAGNLSSYSSTVYATTASAGDTTAPTAPSAPSATVISASQINLSWTASTDAVGVTGYNVERCAGSGCSSWVEVYTPTGTSQNDTGLVGATLYRYRIRAHDLAGNLSTYSTIVQGTTSTQTGSDFATRCAASGVLTCFGFDTTADLNPSFAGADGARGQLYGRFPGGGGNYSNLIIDTAQKTSGAGSLRFTVPGNAADNITWFTNLSSTNLSEQLAAGQTVYIQMRYRVDTNFFAQNYSGSGGFKLFDLSGGDTAGCAGASPKTSYLCPTTCWAGETVFTTSLLGNSNRHLLTGYNNCSGAEPFKGWYGFTTNVTYQTAVNCLYPTASKPPCVYLTPNEWWTIKLKLTIGTYNNYNSTVQVWLGQQGQPTALVHECGPTPLKVCDGKTAGIYIAKDTVDDPPGGRNPNVIVGKLWLETYQTGGSWSGLQDGYAWFDELIISRNDINDPVDTPPAGDVQAPSIPANLTLSSINAHTMDVAWSTSTDDTAVAGYNLERCAGAGCTSFTEIASQAGTSYVDTGLNASSFYNYRVRARDAVPNYSSYTPATQGNTIGPSFSAGEVFIGKGMLLR